MKQAITSLALLLFLAAGLGANHADAAPLSGRIVNGTTGEPGSAELVELIDVAQGMTALATLEDVSGTFEFADVGTESAAHMLLRVSYDGVTYSQSLDGSGDIEIQVYDSTTSLEDVSLTRHHVLFQREDAHMIATELFEFTNASDPPRTVAASALPMRLDQPNPYHGEMTASVGSGQMPVTMPLIPTDQVDGFAVDQALVPGTTRMIVRYNFEYHEGEATWTNTAVYDTEDRRVLVSPTDVNVLVDQMIPTDSPLDGFAAYTGLPAVAGTSWSVRLSGGSEMAAEVGTDHSQHTANAVQSVSIKPHRFSNNTLLWILGMSAALVFALLLGLSRTEAPVAPTSQQTTAVDEKRRRISRVADRYVSGEITREQFEAERDKILGAKVKGAPTNGSGKSHAAARQTT